MCHFIRVYINAVSRRIAMKNNNAIFAQGAYNWALSEAQRYQFANEPCGIDMESTLNTIGNGTGHDVKISIFESPTDSENSEVILMLEWVQYKKEKINIYPIKKDNYKNLKENYGDFVNLFKMNGRIRYMEEINAGHAMLPIFRIES